MSDLFSVITAHCFFSGRCNHSVTGLTPEGVHEEMEMHYRAAHDAEITAIVGERPREGDR